MEVNKVDRHYHMIVSDVEPLRVKMCKGNYENLNDETGYDNVPVSPSEAFTLKSAEIPEWEAIRARKPYALDFAEPTPVLLPELKQGDVIYCAGLRGYANDEAQIALYDAIIATNILEEEFVDFIKNRYNDDHGHSLLGFVENTYDKVTFDIAADRARGEENTAVIIAWRDEKGEMQDYIIGSSGSYMFWSEETSTRDCGINEPDSVGIWIIRNGNAWSTGDGMYEEYDSGMNGNLDSATLEDVEKICGYGAHSLAVEIRSILEIYEDTIPENITFEQAVDILHKYSAELQIKP